MGIDINAVDFIESFDISKGTVGVVGHGYVGSAIEHFFKKSTCNVLVYDKAKPEFQTMAQIVKSAEVIFVCVPTPMKGDGSCYTGIVESVIQSISDVANQVLRNLNDLVVVIKSTVWPGFTESMQYKHHEMRIVFSPEFLTEKSSIEDFENQNRVIMGGAEEDTLVVFKYFEGVDPVRVAEDRVMYLQCEPPTTAEMVKLYANGMLATKVLFSNEIYLMCQKLGLEYEEVRQLACLDQRIGSGHTKVPGGDGKFSFGGSCFPKDFNNLRYTADHLGLSDEFFRTILKRNSEIRGEEDWKDLEGRAVIDSKKQ